MTLDASNTANLSMTPVTRGGIPNIVDDAFSRALASAREGGDPLQSYFDAINQTADFWSFMAENSGEGQNPFTPGTDPQGNPIMMASSGNVDMRYGAFYRGDTEAVDSNENPPVVGIATIQTGNTTNDLSKTLSFGLSVAGLPVGVLLTKKLFADLLTPLYKNMKLWLTKNASNIKQASQVENPDVDPEDAADDALASATEDVEEVGGDLAADGIKYATINWGSGALEVGGLGALAALPLIVSYLGHRMTVSVQIINMTDFDFTWDVAYKDSGMSSVSPAKDTSRLIPKMAYYTDIWGDRTSVKAAYEANFQFINTTDLGSVGNLISLTPSGGSTSVANLLVSVPWAGDNTVWVGEPSGSAEETYLANAVPDEKTSVTATFDVYSITASITKLRGTTAGQYFYGVLALIEPAG